jgi:hypothetical protein
MFFPAVINEIIKPHEHEIITERVHRDIHNYEVYHRIQPVLDTEILPARHFVPSSSQSHLIEVSEQDLPDCTGDNQPWIVGERKSPANEQFHTPQAQLTEPKAGGYQTFTTPEGFERKQTTWLHPAELEDMGGYDGPVMPVHFGEDGQHTEPPKSEITNMRDVRAFSQSGTNANPTTNPSMNPRRTKPAHPPKYINAPVVPPRKSSLRHSMNGSTTIE